MAPVRQVVRPAPVARAIADGGGELLPYIGGELFFAINESPCSVPDRVYLDHAATTPVLPSALTAMSKAMEVWANPSSPHADGRASRAVIEDARRRIKTALGWNGDIVFTSGASEAISIGLGRAKAETIVTSPLEHDAVLRMTRQAERLPVDMNGIVMATRPGALHAIQHVNNETGVIQPLDKLGEEIRAQGGLLFADCAQSAGKLPLPDADMIALSGHKFGAPPGIGALLIRDLTLIHPSGGQEQGYRAGTENGPAIQAMACALEADAQWYAQSASLRDMLDAGIIAGGGVIVAQDVHRAPHIGSYRMPGVTSQAQLIQFDMMGISVSAGSACSSGTIKASHVLMAMGWDAKAAGEVIRVSFGPTTGVADVERFLNAWQRIATG